MISLFYIIIKHSDGWHEQLKKSFFIKESTNLSLKRSIEGYNTKTEYEKDKANLKE